MQRKWAKTNAPEGFDTATYIPSECSRCRGLTEEEREMLYSLLTLRRAGYLTLKRVFNFLRTKNPELRQKIYEGRLRPIDVAKQVVRIGPNGEKLYVYRYHGYTKTYDENFNQILWSFREGGRMIHCNTSFEKVAETYWTPPGWLESLGGLEGHHCTYNLKGELTSYSRWDYPTGLDSFVGSKQYITFHPRKDDDTGEVTEDQWISYEPYEV
jgi:hypothetical protein